MDATWFKARQRAVGVTSFDLGRAISRDRTVISKILSGQQRMTLDQARIFAEMLQVPLPEMIERSGLADRGTAQQLAPGFRESDVVPFEIGPKLGTGATVQAIAELLGGNRPGVDVWQVKGEAMSLDGFLPGDFMVVDTTRAERAKAGDVVVAQVYTREGAAVTVLRRFEPPVLVAYTPDRSERRAYVVDNDNVAIRGLVVASWRA